EEDGIRAKLVTGVQTCALPTSLNNTLIVPVIRNADTLNIAGSARATSDLVTRARSNKLMPADVQGATFTVNNPGVFGTVLSAAKIGRASCRQRAYYAEHRHSPQ